MDGDVDRKGLKTRLLVPSVMGARRGHVLRDCKLEEAARAEII